MEDCPTFAPPPPRTRKKSAPKPNAAAARKPKKMFGSRPEVPFEIDCDYNPYDEEPLVLPANPKKKVHMEKCNHEYVLMCGVEGYPGRILSGSKVWAFAVALKTGNPKTLAKYFEPIAEGTEFPTILNGINLETGEADIEFEGGQLERDLTPPKVDPNSGMYAAQLGTLLHWYAEHRILGYDIPRPPEVSVAASQVDDFFSILPPGFFSHVELGLGSFTYKFCGTIDALHYNPVTKKYAIYDWKSSKLIFEIGKEVLPGPWVKKEKTKSSKKEKEEEEEDPPPGFVYYDDVEIAPGVKCRIFDPVAPPDKFIEYIVQLASYRRLAMLHGYPMDTFVYIPVAHHTLTPVGNDTKANLRLCRVDLTKPIERLDGATPIGVVEWILHYRRSALTRQLGLRPPPPMRTEPYSNFYRIEQMKKEKEELARAIKEEAKAKEKEKEPLHQSRYFQASRKASKKPKNEEGQEEWMEV